MLDSLKPQLKISLIYLVTCSGYILVSDILIESTYSDPQSITRIQSLKGVLFVIFSSILIYYLVKHFIDKYLEAQEKSFEVDRYYQLIFEKNPLPCYIIESKSLNFIRVNKAAQMLFGKTEKQYQSETLEDSLYNNSREHIYSIIDEVRKQGYFETLVESKHKNGSIIHLQVFAQSIRYKSIDCVFIIGMDITSSKSKDQNFMDKMLDAIERERSKISSDIHDGIKQYFGIIKGLLETSKKENGTNSYLEKAIESAELGINESRILSHAIAPGFGGFDLEDSLIHLIENLNLISSIKFELDINLTQGFSEEISLNIYRIIQEATNNILAHSKAKNATVSVKTSNESLMLQVSDDGKGMDQDAFPKSIRSLGLNTIRTRATKLNGQLQIIGDEGKGTTITIKVPLLPNTT